MHAEPDRGGSNADPADPALEDEAAMLPILRPPSPIGRMEWITRFIRAFLLPATPCEERARPDCGWCAGRRDRVNGCERDG